MYENIENSSTKNFLSIVSEVIKRVFFKWQIALNSQAFNRPKNVSTKITEESSQAQYSIRFDKTSYKGCCT